MTKVQLGGTELFVEDRGSGDVLLLVHGFPLDYSMWSHQIDGLSTNFRVIAPDLRGFGQSSGAGERFTMEQFADDLAELLAAIGIAGPVTFCGLSMGGYIAWQFWERHPERLGRLVLCDTRAAADSPEAAAQRLATADRVLQEGSGFLADDMAGKLFSKQSRDKRDIVEATQQVIRATRPASIAAALRGMAERPDMRSKLADVDVPALLLCGADDVITPAAEMREVAAALPRSEFLEIPAAGHMAPLENPSPVNEAIRRFQLQR